MMVQKSTALKVGLLTVAIAYLLFNAHSIFNLNWWGEWDRLASPGSFGAFYIFITDIAAAPGMAFRFVAGIIAVIAVAYYIKKPPPTTKKLYDILKVILVFEAIYWFGLVATAGLEIYFLIVVPSTSIMATLTTAMEGALANTLEAIVLPIILLVLAFKLNPNKPSSIPIKWALISGTTLIVSLWLVNMSLWVSTVATIGWAGVTNYAVNTVSFVLTVVGMLILSLFTAWYTISYIRAKPQVLSLKTVGVIITALGMYFLWEYLSWIFFGGDYLWSNWYAWFLGHNLDLWMLALPLVGIPMLFYAKEKTETAKT
jgi:hypothetical protein